jgi:uncharacterized protein
LKIHLIQDADAMRRKDKEITDRAEMENILRRATVCHLALADAGEPYVVPLCFGYEDGFLYFHTAAEGRKLEMLEKNKRVCFCVETDVWIMSGDDPCDWGVVFQSVIGYGWAEMVDDRDGKIAGLNAVVRQYEGDAGGYSEANLQATRVIRVAIDQMTGKHSGTGA